MFVVTLKRYGFMYGGYLGCLGTGGLGSNGELPLAGRRTDRGSTSNYHPLGVG